MWPQAIWDSAKTPLVFGFRRTVRRHGAVLPQTDRMKVRFTTAARDDIARIHHYIARENPSAAAKVVTAIECATERLAAFPLSGRTGAVEITREVVVPQLPFIAVCCITPFEVAIIGVFHVAQNKPGSTP